MRTTRYSEIGTLLTCFYKIRLHEGMFVKLIKELNQACAETDPG
jgi:hypothetical protein